MAVPVRSSVNYLTVVKPLPEGMEGRHEVRIDSVSLKAQWDEYEEFILNTRDICAMFRLDLYDYNLRKEINVIRLFFVDYRDAVEFKLRFG